jgi:hypothetical protein
LFFATFNNLSVFADENLNKPILSTAQLQLIDRANQLAAKITKPEIKLGKYFELLTFESQFDDKQYARKTAQLISNQIAQLESGGVKNNFYELLALAQSNINDYKQIIVTLNNLDPSIEKSQIQFDIAEKIIFEKEENKSPIPDEVIELLQYAYSGAEIAKDTSLESLAAMELGRVLAKVGKKDEAKKFLNIALKKSDELEEAESKNIKQSILRILIQNKIYNEATAEIQKTKSPETKDLFLSLILNTLAEEGNIEDAKKGLSGIKSDDARDMVAVEISRELAKKGTIAELIELAKVMSSEQRKEIFIQNTISFLIHNKRTDDAAKLIDQTSAKPDARERYNLILIANMIDNKKFDEAEKNITAIADPNFKMQMSRYLILSRIRSNGLKSVVGKTVLSYTEAELKQIAALNAEINKLAAIENNFDRANAGFSLMLQHTKLINPDGIYAVTQTFLNDVDKLDNPAQILEFQYNTARLHFELGNFDGVRETLDRSVKYLDSVKDVMKLKELVLIDEAGIATTNNVTKNNAEKTTQKNIEVNETTIRERLFLTYTSICAMYIDIKDIDAAKNIYEKSKKYLATNDDPIIQFDQTGILSKLLLQIDNAKINDK